MGGTGSIGVYAVAFAVALGASTVVYHDPYEPDAVEARPLTRGAEIARRASRRVESSRSRSMPRAVRRICTQPWRRPRGPAGRCHSVGIFFDDVPLPLSSMFMQAVTFTTGRPGRRPFYPRRARCSSREGRSIR